MGEQSTIHAAARSGDLETVRRLLEADPGLVNADDEHTWRPIFHAALHKHVQVVELLLDYGADIAAHDGCVLHYAAEVANNKPIVELLLKSGALDAHVGPLDDLARQFLSAVFLANEQRVAALISQHPELVTNRDGRGDYPIHHAARNGDEHIVRILLDAGADVNHKNGKGHTVLYCAAGHGHIATVRLLLMRNVDISVKFTDDGKTVAEWLDQYPDDTRFTEVVKLIRSN